MVYELSTMDISPQWPKHQNHGQCCIPNARAAGGALCLAEGCTTSAPTKFMKFARIAIYTLKLNRAIFMQPCILAMH